VHLFGLRHLRDAAAAEDLAQDVLATVIARVRDGAVRDAEKLGGFVLGTARMLVTNRTRLEARRSKILAKYADPPGAEDEPGVRADLDRVGACLGGLAERDRTVLLLSFYAELDAAAIGGELGLEPGNVRVIRHRALARLQACVHAARGEEPS
jgi:RNA polymerase sigma-70 factor (ECF subfamily)